MNKLKYLIGLLAILLGVSAVVWVLSSEKAILMHPKGIMAKRELHIIGRNILLMLTIILPAILITLLVAWKYKARNQELQSSKSRETHGFFPQLMFWVIPSIIVAIMTYHTWFEAHELDPYVPIKSDEKPLVIEVVALNWKWLFIYPEQGVASVNYVQFPIDTVIHFKHAADGSPMNSFWIPQLSGQIYSMTGMVTPIYMRADHKGQFLGRAAEINGDGYADMTFLAESTTQEEFDTWIEELRQSNEQLDDRTYRQLLQPSIKHPVVYFSQVIPGLFDEIVMKYMHPE